MVLDFSLISKSIHQLRDFENKDDGILTLSLRITYIVAAATNLAWQNRCGIYIRIAYTGLRIY